MPLWNESYSVFVPEMDKEHRQFLYLLKRVSRAIGKKYSLEATIEVLDDALEYANTHFTAEEKMLEDHKYPGLNEQKAQHAEFIYQMRKLSTSYHEGNPITPLATINYLSEWFIKHIQGTDKLYGLHFKSQNITPANGSLVA